MIAIVAIGENFVGHLLPGAGRRLERRQQGLQIGATCGVHNGPARAQPRHRADAAFVFVGDFLVERHRGFALAAGQHAVRLFHPRQKAVAAGGGLGQIGEGVGGAPGIGDALRGEKAIAALLR